MSSEVGTLQMVDAYSGLVVPLLTVAFSGVLATIISIVLNQRYQDRRLILSKLEEVYGCLHDYFAAASVHFTGYFSLFRGEIDLNQHYEQTAQLGKNVDATNYRRLEMLLTFYVPEAEKAFAEMLKYRTNLNAIVTDYDRQYRQGDTDGTAFIDPFDAQLKQFNDMEEKLKDIVRQRVRKYT